MQSLYIEKCRKDIQLFNTYFFIIFIYILFFKLALPKRCANFAASSLMHILHERNQLENVFYNEGSKMSIQYDYKILWGYTTPELFM